MPHFIRNNPNANTSLDNSYISILEVGGAHAHRLRALIDILGIPTLVVTDTDAQSLHSNYRQMFKKLAQEINPKLSGLNLARDTLLAAIP
jgi:predicted ATP-dependent endonuclease of OLD family